MEPLGPEIPQNNISLGSLEEKGFVSTFFGTVKKILFETDMFFQNQKVADSIAKPYRFYLTASIIILLVNTIYGVIFHSLGWGPAIELSQTVAALLFLFVGIFLAAGIYHLFVMLFRGKGGFKATFHVICYASATMLCGVIPLVGGVIGGIWGMIVGIKGYKHVHQMGTARAFWAYCGIIIIAFIIPLMAAIAIPNLLRARISANDALAQSTLRALSTAAETYATANEGEYPWSVFSLTSATPPYISDNYCDKLVSGYYYNCDFNSNGYLITATPEKIGASGTAVYTMETGGILSPNE